jgi:hypothetical protein
MNGTRMRRIGRICADQISRWSVVGGPLSVGWLLRGALLHKLSGGKPTLLRRRSLPTCYLANVAPRPVIDY